LITLKPHQQRCAEKGYEIMQRNGVVMLVMQTRTGKTYTAAEIIRQAKKVMWLTTKAAKKDQRQQVEEYNVNADVDYYHYGQMSGLPAHIAQDNTISENKRIEKRFELNKTIKKIINTKYDIVVVDEAHKICQTAQEKTIEQIVLKKLSDKCAPKFVMLSATPTPEGAPTLFHILEATGHSPWQHKSFLQFVRAGYVIPESVRTGQKLHTGKEITKTIYKKATQQVWQDVKHLYVTAHQEEAGIKTTVQERELVVEMSTYTEYLYNMLRKRRYLWIAGDYNTEVYGSTKAVLLSKLLQITGGSVILSNKKHIILDKSKGMAIIRDMKCREYKNAIIFYRFRSERELLRKTIPANLLTENPEDVQSGKKPIFIGQVKRFREGVRFDNVDAMYLYTPDHSYLSYRQAKNRMQHMNREKNPELIWVISHMGYERSVIAKVMKKQHDTNRWYNG